MEVVEVIRKWKQVDQSSMENLVAFAKEVKRVDKWNDMEELEEVEKSLSMGSVNALRFDLQEWVEEIGHAHAREQVSYTASQLSDGMSLEEYIDFMKVRIQIAQEFLDEL